MAWGKERPEMTLNPALLLASCATFYSFNILETVLITDEMLFRKPVSSGLSYTQ